jgi:hypothetical protein
VRERVRWIVKVWFMGYLGGEINNYDGMYGLNENVDIN